VLVVCGPWRAAERSASARPGCQIGSTKPADLAPCVCACRALRPWAALPS